MNCTQKVKHGNNKTMKNERGTVFMPKGKANQEYTGEYKEKIIKDVRENGLSYREAMRKYGITGKETIQKWERIYLESGRSGLYEERRGRGKGGKKGRPPKLEKQVEEDLIGENQRLRMENDYLKKLSALVRQEKPQSVKKRK